MSGFCALVCFLLGGIFCLGEFLHGDAGSKEWRIAALYFFLLFVYLPAGRNYWRVLMCTLALLSLLICPCSSAILRFSYAFSFFASLPLRVFGEWTEETL